ncbi:hypothetical protein AB8880_00525 [Alphaproteobacteria bacterium LSUCC0684]
MVTQFTYLAMVLAAFFIFMLVFMYLQISYARSRQEPAGVSESSLSSENRADA